METIIRKKKKFYHFLQIGRCSLFRKIVPNLRLIDCNKCNKFWAFDRTKKANVNSWVKERKKNFIGDVKKRKVWHFANYATWGSSYFDVFFFYDPDHVYFESFRPEGNNLWIRSLSNIYLRAYAYIHVYVNFSFFNRKVEKLTMEKSSYLFSSSSQLFDTIYSIKASIDKAEATFDLFFPRLRTMRGNCIFLSWSLALFLVHSAYSSSC